MNCPNCGKTVSDKRTNCPYCGTKLPKVNPEPKTPTEDHEKQPVENLSPNFGALIQQEKECVIKPTAEPVKNGVIQCPQCGSTDVTVITDDKSRCNNCGSIIINEKQKDNVSVVNHINVYQNSDKNISYYALRTRLSNVEFLRSAFIDISKNANTPPDVLSATFGQETLRYEQYLDIYGSANISYSATVGYDYYKTVYENGRSTQKSDTRWEPLSGTNQGSYNTISGNGFSDRTKEIDFSYRLSRAKISDPSAIVPYEQADFPLPKLNSISDTSLSEAKDYFIWKCSEEARKNLPGDREKDFRSSGTAMISGVDSYVAPVYSMEYKYKGSKYSAVSLAFSHSYSECGETPNYSGVMTDDANEKSKSLGIFSVIVSILALFSSMITILTKAIPTLVPLICVATSLIVLLVYTSQRKKYLTDAVNENQQSKIKMLESILQKRKFSPLTSGERSEFYNAKVKDLIDKKSKLRKGAIIILVIAAIFAVIALF